MFPQAIVDFYASNQELLWFTTLFAWWGIVDLKTALALGAAKYIFKVVIAAIDTIFIYWARCSFRQHTVAESA